MIKKKLFIVDSKSIRSYLTFFRDTENDLDIEVVGHPIDRIPRDYDTYLLHLSNISLKDLADLRSEQPWSWIYGICGQGKPEIISEASKNLDNLFFVIELIYYRYIIQKMDNSRENKND